MGTWKEDLLNRGYWKQDKGFTKCDIHVWKCLKTFFEVERKGSHGMTVPDQFLFEVLNEMEYKEPRVFIRWGDSDRYSPIYGQATLCTFTSCVEVKGPSLILSSSHRYHEIRCIFNPTTDKYDVGEEFSISRAQLRDLITYHIRDKFNIDIR